MDKNVSEIDDENFFFADDGAQNPKSELFATLDAFFSDEPKDDNSSICRFPARYAWLASELGAKDFPKADCQEYQKIFERVDPKSTTLVFPAAHINSPASMFGHTFLRINSSYNSKLLSYAINYAADANTETENGVVFAIKGLVGGYYGRYSLLPYYEKLKEYRDSEQRDIWEYDLNLTQAETVAMFRHIWELNGTHSYYYFFTENCSYNMLWLLEVARPSLQLRKHFFYEVIPLETVHVVKAEGLLAGEHYRPSKRTKLLKYESLLLEKNRHLPVALVFGETTPRDVFENSTISKEQKIYIFESAVEFLEYNYAKAKITKEEYLKRFHAITLQRAKLGMGKALHIKTPPNPLDSHRAFRVEAGAGVREGEGVAFLGIRPAYHDLTDSPYGFLRGTQIEFMNLLLSRTKKHTQVELANVISIVSIAQRSTFFKNFSWRTHIGWDRKFLNEKSTFNLSVGAGYSWGNRYGYIYFLADPLLYMAVKPSAGIGGSVGLNIDGFEHYIINLEATQRIYDTGKTQQLLDLSAGYRLGQNQEILLQYDYKERDATMQISSEKTLKALFRYYF